MERYKWVQFARKLLPRPATTHRKTVSVPVGAMDKVSGKVQNANTHILRCQNHEDAHSSRSVTQFKGQFKGAMEEIARHGQKVSAPQLPDSSTRWCWSVLPCQRCGVPRPASRKTEHVTFHRGDGGNVADGCACARALLGTVFCFEY